MELTLWTVFFSAFIASTILPAASEFTLWAVVADDPTLLWPGIMVASFGNTLGASINWLLGRYLSNFADRKWYPLSHERQDRASAWFRRFGIWALLFSWLPVIGDPLTVVAGIFRVSFLPFLVLVTVGKTGRYIVVASLAL